MISKICSLCLSNPNTSKAGPPLQYTPPSHCTQAQPPRRAVSLSAAATWAGFAAWQSRRWAAPACSRLHSEGTGCLHSVPRSLQTALAKSQHHASEWGLSLPGSAHTSPCHLYLYTADTENYLLVLEWFLELYSRSIYQLSQTWDLFKTFFFSMMEMCLIISPGNKSVPTKDPFKIDEHHSLSKSHQTNKNDTCPQAITKQQL